MSNFKMLFEAAKAAGLVSAAVTTGVGVMLRKKDQAEDILMAQVSAGERAKEILKRAGRFAEDPEMRKQEINIANTYTFLTTFIKTAGGYNHPPAEIHPIFAAISYQSSVSFSSRLFI